MRSPMRCSGPNRVCSEALSFRVSLVGGQSSLSSLANPKAGVCVAGVERAGMAAKRCLRAGSGELAGAACLGDHVGHREVGAEPMIDAALDLGVAVGQVGVEAR